MADRGRGFANRGRCERARPSGPGRHGRAGAGHGLAPDHRRRSPAAARAFGSRRTWRRVAHEPATGAATSAGYLVGWLLFATAALRALIFYSGQPPLPAAIRSSPASRCCMPPSRCSPRFRWFRFLYFPLQTAPGAGADQPAAVPGYHLPALYRPRPCRRSTPSAAAGRRLADPLLPSCSPRPRWWGLAGWRGWRSA